MSNLSEEDLEIINNLKLIKWKYFEKTPEHTTTKTYSKEEETINTILNLIDRLQKELEQEQEYNDKLTLIFKEKLGNIGFEVETAWRKFEKLEDLLEEN